MNGGFRIADVLKARGVRFLFTLCGGHISPILVGAKARGIRVVDVRHEVNAVFAADAVARLTGVPGVAAVTAGPGVTNTLTAIKNAQLAQSPLVLLGGAAATVLRGALAAIEPLYAAGVTWRNRPYDRDPARARRLPRPVVSIGNITAGGTGKTPVVRWLAGRLRDRGLGVAILSRGYKAAPGTLGD